MNFSDSEVVASIIKVSLSKVTERLPFSTPGSEILTSYPVSDSITSNGYLWIVEPTHLSLKKSAKMSKGSAVFVAIVISPPNN